MCGKTKHPNLTEVVKGALYGLGQFLITESPILPNISRSKVSQAVKLCQLIEYNIKNIFVEKSYTKCAGETTPRPLQTSQPSCISGISRIC